MFLHDAPDGCKPWNTPGRGQGNEVVAVDVPLARFEPLPENLLAIAVIPPPSLVPVRRRRKSPPRYRYLRPHQRAALARMMASGERVAVVAAAFGLTPFGARYSARSSGVTVYGRTLRAQQARERAIEIFRSTVRGRAADAYSRNIEPVYFVATGSVCEGGAVVVRESDDVRVRIYTPRAARPCRRGIGQDYYRTEIAEGVEALIALPDGEAFVLSPRPQAAFISIPATPEKRNLWRSRAVSFRWQP